MHNAPAVSFPVGRSRFQAWFLWLAWLAGAAVSAYWCCVMDVSGWRRYVALTLPMAVGVVALSGWRRQASGGLRWDGQLWWFDTLGSTQTGNLVVHLDFQSFLLLSLRIERGGVRWIWLDRRAAPADWQAFRRAVHSSAAVNARQAGHSTPTVTATVTVTATANVTAPPLPQEVKA